MRLERRAKRILDPVANPAMRRRLIDVRDGAVHGYAGLRDRVGLHGQLPQFLIIGAQKAGTTFLYQELMSHPNLAGSITKELHFFDGRHYSRGIDYYGAHFSSRGGDVLRGEASPGYLFHPHAASRVVEHLPDVKVIALLRDPVRRAFSQWQHERRLGYEPIDSFEAALEAEAERTHNEYERLLEEPAYDSYAVRHYAYKLRGHYAPQIRRWQSAIGTEQILLLESTDLYKDTVSTLLRVHEFLGVEPIAPASIGVNDMAAKSGMRLQEETAAALRESFRPWNAELDELCSIGSKW